MFKKQYQVIPAIALMAVLVLVGQGCPTTQQGAGSDTGTQGEASTTQDRTRASSRSVFDISLPAEAENVKEVGPRTEGEPPVRQTIVNFKVSGGDLEETHNYFVSEFEENDWEITAQGLGVGSDLRAEKGERKITISSFSSRGDITVVIEAKETLPSD